MKRVWRPLAVAAMFAAAVSFAACSSDADDGGTENGGTSMVLDNVVYIG